MAPHPRCAIVACGVVCGVLLSASSLLRAGDEGRRAVVSDAYVERSPLVTASHLAVPPDKDHVEKYFAAVAWLLDEQDLDVSTGDVAGALDALLYDAEVCHGSDGYVHAGPCISASAAVGAAMIKGSGLALRRVVDHYFLLEPLHGGDYNRAGIDFSNDKNSCVASFNQEAVSKCSVDESTLVGCLKLRLDRKECHVKNDAPGSCVVDGESEGGRGNLFLFRDCARESDRINLKRVGFAERMAQAVIHKRESMAQEVIAERDQKAHQRKAQHKGTGERKPMAHKVMSAPRKA